jgi:hypothetical protein
MASPSGIFWILAASIAVNVICLVSLAALWQFFQRQTDIFKQQNKLLEQKISMATSGAIGMGHRIVALEEKLQAAQEKLENIGTEDVFTYSQALQMFEQGADVSTVVSNCGLSSSEAQLMALVQQQLRKSSDAQTQNANEQIAKAFAKPVVQAKKSPPSAKAASKKTPAESSR